MPNLCKLVVRGFSCTAIGALAACLAWYLFLPDRAFLIPFSAAGAIVGSVCGWFWLIGATRARKSKAAGTARDPA